MPAVVHGHDRRRPRDRLNHRASLRHRVRSVLAATQEIQSGLSELALVVTGDRTSNGPHLYCPNPLGPGGTGGHEDWVMDSFGYDPYTT